jgi:calcium-dependent protein kinase
MVEEYCSGGDLYDYIKKQKYFSEKKAAHITSQLISSINHLHKKKIVHRDLKPENIVFIETFNEGEVLIKLIDFGTSIYLKNEFLTQELGTIYYIAPEVFKNHYNEKADIWSIGIILYTMLCGHPPYRGSKEEDIKRKILAGKLDFPKKDFDKVSQEAMDFIIQLLDYNPVKRPTAEQAMQNPWMIKCLFSGEDNKLDNNVAQNLMKFQSAVSLQKASLAFIANQLGQYEDIQQIKDEFDKIDTNKDGILSKEELIECKNPLNVLGFNKLYPFDEAQTKVNEIIAEIDFNNDGTISFSEFMTVTMQKEKLLSEEMLKKAFYMFDLVRSLLTLGWKWVYYYR